MEYLTYGDTDLVFWLVLVGISRYFYQPIPKGNSVGTFWYQTIGRSLIIHIKTGFVCVLYNTLVA